MPSKCRMTIHLASPIDVGTPLNRVLSYNSLEGALTALFEMQGQGYLGVEVVGASLNDGKSGMVWNCQDHVGSACAWHVESHTNATKGKGKVFQNVLEAMMWMGK